MKSIKTYEQFVENQTNEEVNFKKLATAAALAAATTFGSPDKAVAQQKPSTQVVSSYDTQIVSKDISTAQPSSVVQVPALDAQQLKMKLQTNLNQLRSDVNFKLLGPITQIKYYSSGPGVIIGDIQFAISPKSENGVTNAQFKIEIEDGQYSITMLNFNFIHVGTQPVSAGQRFVNTAKPILGRGAATVTQRGISTAMGGTQLGQTVGNVAAGAVQHAALTKKQPKSNFSLQDIEGNNKYSNYSQDVKNACGIFFDSLVKEFK
jgi:hypothetical protein